MRLSSVFVFLLLARRCLLHRIPTASTLDSIHAPNTPAKLPDRFDRFQIASGERIFPRQRRSAHGEVSLSPQIESPTAPSTNSTQTPQNSSPWIPSSEAIDTAVFRTFITILTLFNVNITWRIHGKHCSVYFQYPRLTRWSAFHARNRHVRGRRLWPAWKMRASCVTALSVWRWRSELQNMGRGAYDTTGVLKAEESTHVRNKRAKPAKSCNYLELPNHWQ